jgi:hypothetical protein
MDADKSTNPLPAEVLLLLTDEQLSISRLEYAWAGWWGRFLVLDPLLVACGVKGIARLG